VQNTSQKLQGIALELSQSGTTSAVLAVTQRSRQRVLQVVSQQYRSTKLAAVRAHCTSDIA
jgi:hypothetical protein